MGSKGASNFDKIFDYLTVAATAHQNFLFKLPQIFNSVFFTNTYTEDFLKKYSN